MRPKSESIGKIQFAQRTREYDVVDRNFTNQPVPRYFISYGEGRPFISDEVPAGFRAQMVFHELYEFEVLGEKEGRCLSALKKELERVPRNKLNKYIPFRLEVFGNLIDYLQEHDPESEVLSEVKRSFEHLKSMMK